VLESPKDKRAEIHKTESFGRNNMNVNWTTETLNKILYGLLQQIELVKYLLKEKNNDQRFKEAAQRIIDTIEKYSS
jgi:helix-turn-helix protein